MTYHQPGKLPPLNGPANCLVREDFYLIGIGLRMARALRAAGETDREFGKDYATLLVKARKFIERYELDPADFSPDHPAKYHKSARRRDERA